MIQISQLIQSSEAMTESQGELLNEALRQQFQRKDIQDVIEISFKGIEKMSSTFFTQALPPDVCLKRLKQKKS